MSDERVSTVARVSVTLEVACGSSWGPDCRTDQVYKQASEEAVNRIRQMIDARKEHAAVRIVRDPVVVEVITRVEK